MNAQEQIVAAARAWIGTPYLHQASKRQVGADCLGLVRGVWRETIGDEPMATPAYSPNPRARSNGHLLEEICQTFFQPHLKSADAGDLLLFQIAPRLPARHCGILTPDSTLIHAQELRGVQEVEFSPQWRRRLISAFGFPNKDIS